MKVPQDTSGTGLPAPSTAQIGQPIWGGPSALEVALTGVRAHLTEWMRHEPGARLGRDPEELHQLRVAARRIDATLGLFRHQLPTRLVNARAGAKGVLRALGTARDYDVQLASLRKYCGRLPGAERAAAAPLRARLAEERDRARGRMIGMLDSEATRHWLETLNLASADLPAGASPDAPRAATVMPERVRRRFKKLKNAVRQLDSRSSMQDYHAVRQRAKQLRYAIECGMAVFGKPAEEMLRSLRRLQDQLGAHQDADMAKNRLAALASDPARLPPETLFFMGRLAEHHLGETGHARRTVARSWRKVSGKRWKALRAHMEELSESAAAAPAIAPTVADSLAAPPATGAVLDEPAPRPLRH